LPLVFDAQASPFIRVHRLEVGSLEFAVWSRLRCEKRRVWPANVQFGLLAFFGMDTDTRGKANGYCPDHTLWRVRDLKLALGRIAGAACYSDRTDDDKDGPKLWRRRRPAVETRLRLRRFAAILCAVATAMRNEIPRQKRGDLAWKI